MKKNAFIFRTYWKDVLMGCSPEIRLEVYDAVIEYASSGTIPELRSLAKMAFSFIKREIDLAENVVLPELNDVPSSTEGG